MTTSGVLVEAAGTPADNPADNAADNSTGAQVNTRADTRADIPADTVPSTVDEIVAALRQDPIVVADMLGNGAADQVRADLHTKLDAAQYPVFVVLTRTPVGLDPSSADEELASLVHAELGRDGVYFVRTSLGNGHLVTYGDVDPSETNDDTLVSLARYTGLDQVSAAITTTYGEDARLAPAGEAGIVLDVAARATIPDYAKPVLTPVEVASYTDQQWTTLAYFYDASDPVEPASVGLSALTAVSVSLVVATIAFRLLRAAVAGAPRHRPAALAAVAARPARSKTPPVPALPAALPTAPADQRTSATAAVSALDDDLESRAASKAPPERLRMAIESRDLARDLLSPDHPDTLDVVGAMVVATTASRALREPKAAPYRCCFVNPVHGAGRYQADLPGGLSVPVCRPCEHSLEAGAEPTDALVERRRGRDRPYYAGDSVWARTGFGTLTDELWLDVLRDRGQR